MKNVTLKLPSHPLLKDFHTYVRKMEQERGFSSETVIEQCLLLGEEVGELFKAIRKEQGIKVDKDNSSFGDIKHELADILIYLLLISNRYDINLEEAFRSKEELNKKRE